MCFLKQSYFFFICIFLFACNSTDNGGGAQNSIPKDSTKNADTIANTSVNVDTSKREKTPEDDSGVQSLLPIQLSDFLKKQAAGLRLVPKEKWLAEDYLAGISAVYEESIFVEGDFSGDGKTDYAGFFIDDEGNVKLLAFHKTDFGFEPVLISDEGQLGVENGPQYLGVGCETLPPLATTTVEGESLNLKNPSIVYLVYEKTATIYYYEKGTYKSAQISD